MRNKILGWFENEFISSQWTLRFWLHPLTSPGCCQFGPWIIHLQHQNPMIWSHTFWVSFNFFFVDVGKPEQLFRSSTDLIAPPAMHCDTSWDPWIIYKVGSALERQFFLRDDMFLFHCENRYRSSDSSCILGKSDSRIRLTIWSIDSSPMASYEMGRSWGNWSDHSNCESWAYLHNPVGKPNIKN